MYKLCWKVGNKTSWPLTKEGPYTRNNRLRNEPTLMSWLAANGCCKTSKATFKIIWVSDFLGSYVLLLCFHAAGLNTVAVSKSTTDWIQGTISTFVSQVLYSCSLSVNQNKLTACGRVFLEKLIVTQSRNSLPFLWPQCSLPCSQQRAIHDLKSIW